MSENRSTDLNKGVVTKSNVVRTTMYEHCGNSFTLSLMDNDSVYISMLNTLTCKTYKKLLFSNDINSEVFTIESLYTMLINAFENTSNLAKGAETAAGYDISFKLEKTTMQITVKAVFGGFLNVSQTIVLAEEVLTNDTILNMKMVQFESVQKKEVSKLTQILDAFMTERIIIGHSANEFNQFVWFTRATTVLDFTQFPFITGYDFKWIPNTFHEFNKLKLCREVVVSSLHLFRFSNVMDFNQFDYYLPGVETLVIVAEQDSPPPPGSNPQTGNPYKAYPPQNYSFPTFKALPNLSTIVYKGFHGTSVNSVLALIKTKESVKNLKFIDTLQIAELDAIKAWCDVKHINIEFCN